MAKRISSDILAGFEDATGTWCEAPQETLAALAAAMGQPPRKAKGLLIVAQRGSGRRRLRSGELVSHLFLFWYRREQLVSAGDFQ